MRFTEKSRDTTGDHSLEPFLLDKTGVEQNDDIWIYSAKPDKSFLAVHEGHREIKQDEVEMPRPLPKDVQALES